MKTGYRAGMAILASALMLSSAVFAASPGETAPEFSLAGGDNQVMLSELRGKTVYVDFWASWCGPCRQSFPWMNSLQQKYADQGLVVVAINLDQRSEDAQQFLAAMAHDFLVVFDPAGVTPREYGVKGMPTSVLIDKHGKVVFQHIGFHSDKADAVEQKIKGVL